MTDYEIADAMCKAMSILVRDLEIFRGEITKGGEFVSAEAKAAFEAQRSWIVAVGMASTFIYEMVAAEGSTVVADHYAALPLMRAASSTTPSDPISNSLPNLP